MVVGALVGEAGAREGAALLVGVGVLAGDVSGVEGCGAGALVDGAGRGVEVLVGVAVGAGFGAVVLVVEVGVEGRGAGAVGFGVGALVVGRGGGVEVLVGVAVGAGFGAVVLVVGVEVGRAVVGALLVEGAGAPVLVGVGLSFFKGAFQQLCTPLLLLSHGHAPQARLESDNFIFGSNVLK